MRTSVRRRLAAHGNVLGLGLAAILLAGCSGSGAGPGEVAGVQRENASAADSAPVDASRTEGLQARSDGDQAGAAKQSISDTDIAGRDLIRTGTMTIRTRRAESAAERAAALVDAGEGYVANSRTTSDGGDGDGVTSIHLVLRVPVDDYDRVVAALERLGKVTVDDHETTDVTSELVDVESRIASQESSIRRLRTLMSRAKTVGEVIQVESELATREADLEALQSRQAALGRQAALSTLEVTFEEPERDKAAPDDDGFLAGLNAGWSALVAFGRASLTVIGAVLPFLVTLAVLAVGPLWFGLRLRARRRATAAGSEALAAD